MSGYSTRLLTVRVDGHDYRIRALSDLQQFSDPQGLAELAGISSALWSLFGQVWPAGRVLAQAMSQFDVAGKRVLELGCGLGLASLVLHRRQADITASDHHPLAEEFLAHNVGLNGLPKLRYLDLDWNLPQPSLGEFDLVIASDVLYERGHAEQLATLLASHMRPSAEVLITDPGRGNSGAFTTAMKKQGYSVEEIRSAFSDDEVAPFRGRLLTFRR